MTLHLATITADSLHRWYAIITLILIIITSLLMTLRRFHDVDSIADSDIDTLPDIDMSHIGHWLLTYYLDSAIITIIYIEILLINIFIIRYWLFSFIA